MRVFIIDINQRYSLGTQTFSNVITFQLPTGEKLQASVDDAAIQVILRAAQAYPAQAPQVAAPPPAQTNGAAHAPAPYVPPPPPEGVDDPVQNPFLVTEEFTTGPTETPVDWPERQVEHHVSEGLVEWETLPDTQLPPQVRQIMRASGVSPQLSIEDLDRLKLEISSRLAKRPKVGDVDWDSGPRRRVEGASIRTVPKDEAGNPIPPGGIVEMRDSSDPGEVRDEEDAMQA